MRISIKIHYRTSQDGTECDTLNDNDDYSDYRRSRRGLDVIKEEPESYIDDDELKSTDDVISSTKRSCFRSTPSCSENNDHIDSSASSPEMYSGEVKSKKLTGVRAFAAKMQDNMTGNMFTDYNDSMMPPSQVLKLRKLLAMDNEDLSKPVPISRRTESRVKSIARQLGQRQSVTTKTVKHETSVIDKES